VEPVKTFGLLLVCLAVFACAPPYIEELDSVAGLARKMTVVGTLGPVKGSFGNGQNAMTFLPVKPTAAVTGIGDLNVQSGFTITEDGGYQYLQFAFVDSSGKVQLTSNMPPFPLAGADPNYPLYEFDVTTTTTTANLVVVSPGLNTSMYCTAALPGGPLNSVVSMPLTSTVLPPFGFTSVVGVQMVPQSSGPDKFNFLLTASGTFGEGTDTASGAGAVFGTGSSSATLASVPVARALYFKSPLGPSYASYFVPGSGWVCSQWTAASTPTPLTGVSHRIDAVLTSGDLLSTEGGILRLYDPNGTQVRSVSLGGLQFCYEAYIGPTTPYVFFSLAIDLNQDYWAFRVYAVPTSSIRDLGG
jgi:hypothetical protein